MAERRQWGETVALAWGFAEATVFFVIPDVALSLLGIRRGMRASLRPVVLAVVGAVLGGLLMWGWGSAAFAGAADVMESMPAIDSAMIDVVGEELEDEGMIALFNGPRRAQPYKIYAAQAGAAGEHPALLALMTVAARLPRFLFITALAALIGAGVRRIDASWAAYALWATGWLVSYALLWG